MIGTVRGWLVCAVLVAGVWSWAGICLAGGTVEEPPRKRRFVLRYAAGVRQIPPGTRVRLWIPLWLDTPYQQLHALSVRSRHRFHLTRDPRYGNQMLYTSASVSDAGPLVQIELELTRSEVRKLLAGERARQGDGRRVEPLMPQLRRLFLSPARLVPVGGPALKLLKNIPSDGDRLELARALYRTVLDHMSYRKVGTGWGRGSVEWACTAGYGNCTDFHSLFMAMTRYYGIPTKFVIGFPLPEERGSGSIAGYHCWAYFYDDMLGWVPVDISEADKHPELAEYYFGNLTENRVALSVGRDIPLDPPAATGPLNYFVYPHVEINGRAADRRQVWWQVEFRDLDRP